MEQEHAPGELGPEFSAQEKKRLEFEKQRTASRKIGGPKDKPREGREFVMHKEPSDLSWKDMMMSERGQEFWEKFSKEERLQKMIDTWRELFYDARFHEEGGEKEMRQMIAQEADREQIVDAIFQHLEQKPDFALLDLYRDFVGPQDTERLGALLLQDEVMLAPDDRSNKTTLADLLAVRGEPKLSLAVLSEFADRVRNCEYTDLSGKGLDPPPAKRAADQRDLLRAVEQLEKRIESPAMTYAAGSQEREELLKEVAILRAQARAWMREAEEELSKWAKAHPERAGRFAEDEE